MLGEIVVGALFFLALTNSTVISVTSAALSVFLGALAGYGLARRHEFRDLPYVAEIETD